MSDDKFGPSESGLEEYPKSTIVLANLMMVLWLVLGTIASWFFSPVAAAIYTLFGVLMVFFVLRKIICTNCYYYDKWCAMGWGKLAALFFKQGDIGKFSTSAGIKFSAINLRPSEPHSHHPRYNFNYHRIHHNEISRNSPPAGRLFLQRGDEPGQSL
jgi:hypothetical protein